MAGQPTKYKEEYNEQVTKLCLLGATDEELASFFNVVVATIYNWKNQEPTFLEAIKEGKEEADAAVAHSLYQKAIGGDSTAMIFWLKNRRKQNWRDKHDIEQKTIHSFESMTDEQLEDIIRSEGAKTS